MNKERNVDKLKAVGGVRELAKALGVDENYGLDTSPIGQKFLSIEDRKEVFGKNEARAFKPKTSFAMTKALLKSHILTPYIIAGMVTMILGLSFEEERENLGWVNSIGVWINVLIVVLAGVAFDYQLIQNRGEVNHEKDVYDVTVLRNGKEQLIKNSELLIGDILILSMDVTVAADGLLFFGNDLYINEEVVTGESKPIKKSLVEDPFCCSGSRVTNGSGRILVTAVGEDSELGQTLKMVTDSTEYGTIKIKETSKMMPMLNKASLCLGVLCFIVLLIRWMVAKEGFPIDKISDKGPIQFLMLASVIIVLELPEGYLLLFVLSDVYMLWKFAKDKIYVQTPYAFEWMSNLKTICFDKTGTLTENRMTVVKGWFQGTYYDELPSIGELEPSVLKLITENASLNSEVFLDTEEDRTIQFIGNQTEGALLILAEKFGVDYSDVRSQKRQLIMKNYGFNSDKKMSSVVVGNGDLLRLYNKGAAEIVLNKCTQYIDPSGSTNPISEDMRIQLENTIARMASQGLRTLALSYVDLDPNEFNFSENGEPLDEFLEGKRGFAEAPEEDLVLLAIVGIKDPIREGVPEVVEQFKKAKIRVRMITGDSLETAKQVAKECGILTSEGLAMEGAEFRQSVEQYVGVSIAERKLQVLARSSPSDKEKLVELLMSRSDGRVAVSGDGTNDARALKTSKIGIAMGASSTEVAKEAANVVILNNSISSILTFYRWSQFYGVNVFRYLQFRLSMSLVVWIVVLVSVCVGGDTPLSVRQFLWAKFIVDTLVVFTLIAENPYGKAPDYSSNQGTDDPKVDTSERISMLLPSLYQIIVILSTFYSLSSLFKRYEVPAKDEFYFHYCFEDPSIDTQYGNSPIGPLCDQYLNCTHSTKSCTLFEEQRLDDLGLPHDFRDHIMDEYEDEHDMVKMRKTSLIFNVFVLMQLSNALNCRKEFDDYTIFEGLLNSLLSCILRITIIGLQLVIMLTPLRSLFKLAELNAWEWVYSIIASILIIPLGAFTRYLIKTGIFESGMDSSSSDSQSS